MVFAQYTWVMGLSIVAAFASAFGIGANDVANAFASSVASRALTMLQAVFVAGLFEFLGAILLGASVTDTIKNSIAKTSAFSTAPAILVSIVYGILVRLLVLRSKNPFKRAVMVVPWLIGLTFFVIVIFVIQTGNKNKTWAVAYPLWKSILISVGIAIFFFLLTQFVAMPVWTARINRAYAQMQRDMHTATMADAKTMSDVKDDDLTTTHDHLKMHTANGDEESPAVAAATVAANPADHQTMREETDYLFIEKVFNAIAHGMSRTLDVTGLRALGRFLARLPFIKLFMIGSTYQIHNVHKEGHKDYNADMVTIQARAEAFDWRTERLFSYAQICSACVMSFAHGANDVANAMGPFAAIYTIWQTSSVASKSNVPIWILVVGGAGIVCGLALYGHKIMRVLGCEVAQLTCARGFAVELSTATVVMVASYSGLPVSTTQTVTGAIVAVGCFEGLRGVNWKMALKIFIGWVLTLLVTAFLCAGLTSLAVYAPNKPGVYDTVYVTGRLNSLVNNVVREVNGTNRVLPAPNTTLTATLNVRTRFPVLRLDMTVG
ncbi:hypothetical protein WJX84_008901 [Apatococcus fuscideae]|uniref:Phosphate transporter n=1 Tax=Apatococcus fuscideae TaxID=2026836 RepID=A0AAW1SZR1_9CHLO